MRSSSAWVLVAVVFAALGFIEAHQLDADVRLALRECARPVVQMPVVKPAPPAANVWVYFQTTDTWHNETTFWGHAVHLARPFDLDQPGHTLRWVNDDGSPGLVQWPSAYEAVIVPRPL